MYKGNKSQINLSANCSSSASSPAFMRERMVTMGSTISQSFMASIIVRITLPAEGAQLPFSMLQVIKEIVHHGEYACIVARGSYHYRRIAEGILDNLSQILTT